MAYYLHCRFRPPPENRLAPTFKPTPVRRAEEKLRAEKAAAEERRRKAQQAQEKSEAEEAKRVEEAEVSVVTRATG